MQKFNKNNTFMVLPVAVWGYANSCLNIGAWRSDLNSEYQIGILIGVIMLNVVYVTYYILLERVIMRFGLLDEKNRIYAILYAILGVAYSAFRYWLT